MALQPLGITAVAKNVEGFMRNMNRMSGGIQGVGRRAGALTQQMSALGTKIIKFGVAAGAAAIAGVAALGVGLAKLAIAAAPLEGIQKAFEGLTESIEGGSIAMLAALKTSSAGMVTNIDLMKSFNLAAQLISVDFAERMPDAMQYLGKVAAATGQDMAFLMDSLVRGVGRLSPMILDNLAIQVDLTAAYEAWSDEMGIAVADMNKTQQQAAVMNQVMIQLKKNTADMPDVIGTAAQQWESFKVTIKDAKDEMGLALLPMLSNLLSRIKPLIQQALPRLLELFKERIIPTINKVVNYFLNLVEVLADAGIRSIEFKEALTAMFPDDFQKNIIKAIDTIERWIDLIKEFVTEHKDKIIAAIEGISVALVAFQIIAIIDSITDALGLLSHPLGIILGLAALLGIAWSENWLGIRDILTAFWEETGRPIFEKLVAWLGEKVPLALEALTTFWEKTGRPMFEKLAEWLGEKVPEAIETLRKFWEDTLYPTLQTVWAWIDEHLLPVLAAFARLMGETIKKDIEILVGVWQNVLQPALKKIYEWFKDKIGPAMETVGEILDRVAGFFNMLADAIKNVQLPDWMTPGSMTPLEKGLRGISDAMMSLSGIAMPSLVMATQQMAAPVMARQVTNNWNLNVTTMAPRESLIADYQMLAAMSERS